MIKIIPAALLPKFQIRNYSSKAIAGQTLSMLITKLKKVESGKYKDVERNLELLRIKSLKSVKEVTVDGNKPEYHIKFEPIHKDKVVSYFNSPLFHVFGYEKKQDVKKASSFYWKKEVAATVKEEDIQVKKSNTSMIVRMP